MKLPFIDIHIVRGRNVVTDKQLDEQAKKHIVRNKVVANLLHENLQLKDIVKGGKE